MSSLRRSDLFLLPSTNLMKYEYGIGGRVAGGFVVHRENMSKDRAYKWFDEWIEMGGNPNMFYIIRRPIGEWEIYREPA